MAPTYAGVPDAGQPLPANDGAQVVQEASNPTNSIVALKVGDYFAYSVPRPDGRTIKVRLDAPDEITARFALLHLLALGERKEYSLSKWEGRFLVIEGDSREVSSFGRTLVHTHHRSTPFPSVGDRENMKIGEGEEIWSYTRDDSIHTSKFLKLSDEIVAMRYRRYHDDEVTHDNLAITICTTKSGLAIEMDSYIFIQPEKFATFLKDPDKVESVFEADIYEHESSTEPDEKAIVRLKKRRSFDGTVYGIDVSWDCEYASKAGHSFISADAFKYIPDAEERPFVWPESFLFGESHPYQRSNKLVDPYSLTYLPRREGSFLKSAGMFFKGVASVVSTKLYRKEVLEEELKYYLSSGNKGSAERVAYRLGDVLWRLGDYDMAERAWIAGARVFLGDDNIGALQDDPQREEIIDRLKSKGKIVDKEGYHLDGSLVGMGSEGSTYKVFGEPKVIKIYSDQYLFPGSRDRTSPKYKTLQVRQRLIVDTVHKFALQRSLGFSAPRVQRIMPAKYMIRDLVYGPIYHDLSNPIYGLSQDEIISAQADFKMVVKEFSSKNLLSDGTDFAEINFVYDTVLKQWVVIDP